MDQAGVARGGSGCRAPLGQELRGHASIAVEGLGGVWKGVGITARDGDKVRRPSADVVRRVRAHGSGGAQEAALIKQFSK